jgi:hypothetical protein
MLFFLNLPHTLKFLSVDKTIKNLFFWTKYSLLRIQKLCSNHAANRGMKRYLSYKTLDCAPANSFP